MPDNWIVEIGSTSTVGGSGEVASAGNVTGLVCTCVYVSRAGKLVRQLHFSATRPDPVGTFKGLHLYREEPDQSATEQLIADGAMEWNGATALGETANTAISGPKVPYPESGAVIIWDGLDPLDETLQVRVYASSFNTSDVENEFVRNNEESPTPSVVVTCGPPAVPGEKGREWAEVVGNPSAAWAYGRNPHTGNPTLIITTAFTKPADPDYVGVVVKLLRADGVEYTLTGTEQEDHTTSYVDEIPAAAERMVVRWYSVGQDVNTYVRHITPEYGLEVEHITTADPLPNVTDFRVSYAYERDAATGQTALKLRPYFTGSTHSTYAYIEFWAQREDSVWYHLGDPSQTGVEGEATIFQLPAVTHTWNFAAVSQDKDSMNRDGHVQTNSAAFPAGTPMFSLSIDPPPIAAPLAHVTGFSVASSYVRDSSGKTVLKLTPTFTKPSDPAWTSIEFWAQREDSNWYLLGYPSNSGSTGAAFIEQLPTAAHTWNFLAVSQDVNGRDRAGNVTTNPASPPSGTPATSLSIPLPTTIPAGSGFSVAASYSAENSRGECALLLTPTFTPPTDTGYAYMEFWAKREDGNWYLLGYPSIGGASDVATINQLPTTTATWDFLLVAIDVNGKNRAGSSQTNPASPPAGTLTYSLSVGPPPLTSFPFEYAAPVTSLSVGLVVQTFSEGGVDWQEWCFQIAWANPSDHRYGGLKIAVIRTSGTPAFLDPIYTDPTDTSVRTPFRSFVPGEVYTVYAISRNKDGVQNSLDTTGTTPRVTGLTPTSTTPNTLNLGRANTATFNNAEFEIVGGAFQAKLFASEKIYVGSILRVGGGTGSNAASFGGFQNGQIAVYNSFNQLRAWFGQNGATFGGWAAEFYIGGAGPGSAKIYCDASGNAYFSGSLVAAGGTFAGTLSAGISITSPVISGGSLSITGGSHTTTIDTANGFRISLPSFATTVSMNTGQLRIENSGGSYTTVGPLGVTTVAGAEQGQLGAGAINLYNSGVNTFGIDTGGTYTASSAAAGGVGSLPATVAGYLIAWIAGVQRKIPYYA